jgi:hypothetical protein
MYASHAIEAFDSLAEGGPTAAQPAG